MMQSGRHLNLVNLLGIVTDNIEKRKISCFASLQNIIMFIYKPRNNSSKISFKTEELLVITEYCRFGILRNYLKKHRKDFINQIDPNKGVIDPKFGTSNLALMHNKYNGIITNNKPPNGTYQCLYVYSCTYEIVTSNRCIFCKKMKTNQMIKHNSQLILYWLHRIWLAGPFK